MGTKIYSLQYGLYKSYLYPLYFYSFAVLLCTFCNEQSLFLCTWNIRSVVSHLCKLKVTENHLLGNILKLILLLFIKTRTSIPFIRRKVVLNRLSISAICTSSILSLSLNLKNNNPYIENNVVNFEEND